MRLEVARACRLSGARLAMKALRVRGRPGALGLFRCCSDWSQRKAGLRQGPLVVLMMRFSEARMLAMSYRRRTFVFSLFGSLSPPVQKKPDSGNKAEA